jgi:hypothetical protein
MKKSNPARQKLLQKKRTKRNQARKGKTYDASRWVDPRFATVIQKGSTPEDKRVGETTLVL